MASASLIMITPDLAMHSCAIAPHATKVYVKEYAHARTVLIRVRRVIQFQRHRNVTDA